MQVGPHVRPVRGGEDEPGLVGRGRVPAVSLGLALGGPRWLGALTPLGGLAFISGWLALGWSFKAR